MLCRNRGLSLALMIACWQLLPGGAAEPAPDSPTVLYFHTEYFPYQQTISDPAEHHLAREFMRQALIATASCEFGIPTRDQSLGELVPKTVGVRHLALLERASWKTKQWHVKLYDLGTDSSQHDTSQLWDKQPLWQATFNWPGNLFVLERLAPILTTASRNEFTVALKSAGLAPRPRSSQSQASPVPREVLDLLKSVDFVDQFQVARIAHQALGEHSDSTQWLEVLVRSYANLSMLTQHHWSSASEVFAARSFLYAERLVQGTDTSDRALWNRAYAWALGGLHHLALADIETLEERAQAESQLQNAAKADRDERPEWGELIQQLCLCDRAALDAFGQRNLDWKPWSHQLKFFLTRTYGFDEWMLDESEKTLTICPAAYGVYAALASSQGSLRATRTGAYLAPKVFERQLPASCIAYAALPENVRAATATPSMLKAAADALLFARSNTNQFSAVPSKIAKELRIASDSDDAASPFDWSILAAMIEEEQFLQVAHFLSVSLNATEHSLQAVVDQVLPLVKEHRYAPYIESYRFHRVRQWTDVTETLSKLQIVDPSRSMDSMLQWIGSIKNAAGEPIGSRAYYATARDLTIQGMYEYCFFRDPTGSEWIPTPRTSFAERLAKEVLTISPHLELGLRMEIALAEKPTLEQLSLWKQRIRDDGESLRLLAQHFVTAEQYQEAKACYQASLELISRYQTATELAALMYRLEGLEKWEQSLLAYIESTPEYGLSQATAHKDLATGLSAWGEWERAKPYAVAAAETYAGWGLSIAGEVTEALAEWEDSEEYYKALSQNYPTASGESWYYFCCRTGRGQREDALRLAEQCVRDAAASESKSLLAERGVFELLRGDKRQALDLFRQALEADLLGEALTTIQLANELDESALAVQALDQLEKHLEQRFSALAESKTTSWETPVRAAQRILVRLIRDKSATPEQIAEFDQHLYQMSRLNRSWLAYHMGVEMDRQGNQALADAYYQRSMNVISRSTIHASLAGQRLVAKYGHSRPTDQPLTKKDLWPPPAAEK